MMCDHCQCNHVANYDRRDRDAQKPALKSRGVHKFNNLFSLKT